MLFISLNRSSHAGTIERTCVEKKPVEFVSCKAIVVDKPEDQMAEGVSPGAVGECRNRRDTESEWVRETLVEVPKGFGH